MQSRNPQLSSCLFGFYRHQQQKAVALREDGFSGCTQHIIEAPFIPLGCSAAKARLCGCALAECVWFCSPCSMNARQDGICFWQTVSSDSGLKRQYTEDSHVIITVLIYFPSSLTVLLQDFWCRMKEYILYMHLSLNIYSAAKWTESRSLIADHYFTALPPHPHFVKIKISSA